MSLDLLSATAVLLVFVALVALLDWFQTRADQRAARAERRRQRLLMQDLEHGSRGRWPA